MSYKIEIKDGTIEQPGQFLLKHLHQGDLFKIRGGEEVELYIGTDEREHGDIRCVRLSNGYIADIDENTVVIPHRGTLTVEIAR